MFKRKLLGGWLGLLMFISSMGTVTALASQPVPPTSAEPKPWVEIQDVQFQRLPDGSAEFKLPRVAGQVVPTWSLTEQCLQIMLTHAVIAQAWAHKVPVQSFQTAVANIIGQNLTEPVPAAQFTLALRQPVKVTEMKQPKWWVYQLQPLGLHKQAKEEVAYTGRPITLNFQQIPVQAVLRVIAEFTGLNIVVSDAVKGEVTLSLKEVPWDQALAIILQSKGLDQRRQGKVIYIAPAAEIANQDKLALQIKAQDQALAPLKTDYFPVTFADAQQLAQLLTTGGAFLTERGSVVVDKRTNTLIVSDTAEQLPKVQALLKRLDVPVKQVLIEARIVAVNKNALQELGIKWTSTHAQSIGHIDGVNMAIGGVGIQPGFSSKYNTFGLALSKLPTGFMLDMELQALETEGDGEVISSPHLMVSNKEEAYIEQGKEVPYTAETASGATQVQFKKAVLGLRVTPQITPDGHVILQMQVNNDHVSKDKGEAGNIPIINTTEVKTQILVKNGQTVVLGGIYVQEHNKTARMVPFLGDMPGVGWLFRSTAETHSRAELLIFVTPKIVTSYGSEASQGILNQYKLAGQAMNRAV